MYKKVGEYSLREKIGAGSFGTVYKVTKKGIINYYSTRSTLTII